MKSPIKIRYCVIIFIGYFWPPGFWLIRFKCWYKIFIHWHWLFVFHFAGSAVARAHHIIPPFMVRWFSHVPVDPPPPPPRLHVKRHSIQMREWGGGGGWAGQEEVKLRSRLHVIILVRSLCGANVFAPVPDRNLTLSRALAPAKDWLGWIHEAR